MQQTERYKLNQWDGADRILREDFNADNAKIDAALGTLSQGLAGKMGKWAKPGGLQQRVPSSLIQLKMLDSIVADWTQWEYIVIQCRHIVQNAGPADTFKIQLAGTGETFAEFKASQSIILLAPHHNPSVKVNGFVVGSEVVFFTSAATTFQDFLGFQFSQSGPNGEARLLSGYFMVYTMK